MTAQQFVNTLAGYADRFQQLVSHGAQWELASHDVIFQVLLQLTNVNPIMEFPYKNLTNTNTQEKCDFVCQHGADMYAIEVKVESATNQNTFAGMALQTAQHQDVVKLQQLNQAMFDVQAHAEAGPYTFHANSLSRWFLAIAWSATARGQILSNAQNYDITCSLVNPPILFALLSV